MSLASLSRWARGLRAKRRSISFRGEVKSSTVWQTWPGRDQGEINSVGTRGP